MKMPTIILTAAFAVALSLASQAQETAPVASNSPNLTESRQHLQIQEGSGLTAILREARFRGNTSVREALLEIAKAAHFSVEFEPDANASVDQPCTATFFTISVLNAVRGIAYANDLTIELRGGAGREIVRVKRLVAKVYSLESFTSSQEFDEFQAFAKKQLDSDEKIIVDQQAKSAVVTASAHKQEDVKSLLDTWIVKLHGPTKILDP
jgi:hypothetical protein